MFWDDAVHRLLWREATVGSVCAETCECRRIVTFGRKRKSRKVGISREKFFLPRAHNAFFCCMLPTGFKRDELDRPPKSAPGDPEVA
jgi:hypothetical protein